MLTASMEKKSLEGVMKVIQDLGKNARKEIRAAISATAGKVKIASARRLKTELKAPSKILKKAIVIAKRSGEETRSEWMGATVILFGGYPIPLKYFTKASKAQRDRKKRPVGGVSFTISSTNKGRLPNAFIVPKYERKVYQRVGKERGPIKQQYGPAPGQFYQSLGIADLAVKVAEEQLPKQVAERVRYLTLQAQGKLKGKQK